MTVTNSAATLSVGGAIQTVSANVNGLSKAGVGTLELRGANSYTGATNVNGGTLAITGSTQATNAINFASNSSLRLSIGSPVTASSAAVSFANGLIEVAGTPNAPSHVLLTALSFTGTPMLAGSISGYQLQVVGNQLQLNQVVTNPYVIWAGAGVAFDADANNDRVDNGIAWLLGAGNPSENALNRLPAATRNGTMLRLTFRCLKSANRGGAVLKVQSSNDLGQANTWTVLEAVVPDVDLSTPNGIVSDTTDDGAFINVIADIPVAGSRHFGRLMAQPAP